MDFFNLCVFWWGRGVYSEYKEIQATYPRPELCLTGLMMCPCLEAAHNTIISEKFLIIKPITLG